MKTRLRTLRIGARRCAWTARITHAAGEHDCHRAIRLRVWGNGTNSRTLQVDLLSTTPPGPWGACATDTAYPTSGDVRAIVDYALVNGWETDEVGGTFVLTEHEHAAAFELPDFLITDRLNNPSAPDPTERVRAAGERSDVGEFH
ncbi:hypothetical protein GCM10009554_58150 [Kribbella koreensis]|uniref:Integrase n=1 Tax=Kribbella koreensis TaxID=57909 RepID=A0ABP4BR06_9ACTN